MAQILVDDKFEPGIKEVIIGPCNDRPGSIKLGNNQSITQEEAIGNWKKFRGQFGFK